MATPVAELGRMFGFPERLNLAPRWNVAPTQEVPVLRAAGDGDEPGPHLVPMRWGLVPFWAKDAAIGSKMINARADTLAQKPAFREALKRRRAVLPADGFYEWRLEGGKKMPLYIRRRDGLPLAFAGLWESWKGPKEAPLPQPLLTATIVTTDANAPLRALHDRMPVILDPDGWRRWLDPATPVAEAEALLKPAPDDLLELIPVSTRVNSVRNDDAACIAPLAAGEAAGAVGTPRLL